MDEFGYRTIDISGLDHDSEHFLDDLYERFIKAQVVDGRMYGDYANNVYEKILMMNTFKTAIKCYHQFLVKNGKL